MPLGRYQVSLEVVKDRWLSRCVARLLPHWGGGAAWLVDMTCLLETGELAGLGIIPRVGGASVPSFFVFYLF